MRIQDITIWERLQSMFRNSYIQQNSDIQAAGGLVPMVVE
jgi:ATP-dependent Clp protease, protease subunit